MHRLSRSVVACLVLLVLGLAIGSGAALPWESGAGAALAQQQPAPADPASNVEATIHGNTVTWRTVPAAFVRLEVRNAAGQMVGAGTALADQSGNVTITLGGGGGGPGRPAGQATIQPGYVLRLTPTGGTVVAVTVPTLAIGADVENNHVVGRGPAGTPLALEVVYAEGAGGTFQQTVTPDASGDIDVALADPVVLAPGVTGGVTLTTAENNTFHAVFEVLQAEVTIGGRQVSGRATLGTTVAATVSAADGRTKTTGTVAVSGTPAWTVAGGGGAPGMARGGPVAVGDTISVTQRSALPGTTFTLRGTVPNLTIAIDLGTHRVTGQAPANAAVEVRLESPYGEVVSRPGTTDADGNFSIDASDVPDFGRGWRAVVSTDIVPGLRVSAYQVIAQVRIGVHRSIVNGVAAPGIPITVTVSGADGNVKGTQSTRATNQGDYTTAFAGDATIAVGDMVAVEFVSGDPIVVPVSDISAQTDAAAETVSGKAPAGTSVRVSQTGTGGIQTVVVATADSVGRYTADFTGKLDIVAPMSGDMVVRLAGGHELFTSWAAVQMTLELREPFLTGNGPAGRAVAGELVDGSGTVVATGAATVAGVGGGGPAAARPAAGTYWTFDFEDTLGAAVAIQPGDTVRATVGDDRFTIVVPPLSGVAFVATDIVNGRTSPDRPVALVVQRAFTGENASAEVTSDAAGNFTHDFAGTFDLQHNDAMLFTTLEGGHIINSRLLVPGLTLDLDTGRLVGSWRPNAQVTYTLTGPAGVRCTNAVQAGDDAVFTALLTDRAGERVVPAQGDALSVAPAEAAADTPLELTVPELTITWDAEANTVGGRATAGGAMIFTLSDAVGRQGGGGGPGMGGLTRVSQPEIGADGAYTVTLRPPYDIQPGTEMLARYRIPSGHIVIRTRYEPILNVQHGGSSVCGFTLPREQVTARLTGPGGVILGAATTRAAYNSRYAGQIVDTAGAPVITAEGQTVRAVLGGKEAAVTLPPLTVQVDWARGRVTGTGPANTTFQVIRPARGCLDIGARQMGGGGRVGQNGEFALNVPGLDPGDGFELAFFTTDGHRFYRDVFRSLGQIWVYTDVVTGRATPSTPVTVVLLDAAGAERGRATTVASAVGTFLVQLTDASGNPVTSAPGDKVRLEASGETPEIVVEDLRFDWSPGEPIIGTAPAGRVVTVTVWLTGGTTATFTRLTDAGGSFRFTEADVPPRSAWGIADITAVRAIYDTPNEHNIVSGTESPTGPVEEPERGATIYLPQALSKG